MSIYVITDKPADFPLRLPIGCELISAKRYIAHTDTISEKRPLIYNLCRSYTYQSLGYYVSLLAEARGHRVLPGVSTLQDFNMQAFVRRMTTDSQSLINKSLGSIQSHDFYLSIYFGQNMAKRHARLAAHFFALFPAPLMRVHFLWQNKEWKLRDVRPMAPADIPAELISFAEKTLSMQTQKRQLSNNNSVKMRFDLAVLVDPKEKHPPSNNRALAKFARIAHERGLRLEFIGKEDRARLREFDALFIRETTRVNHHTYNFARRAQADDLIVIDDPESILKCTNKVFLAELMTRHKIRTPHTVIVHKSNKETALAELGLPCVLKQPDSAFSQGVVRVTTPAEWRTRVDALLLSSELIIAQEYLPSTFDWRIGMLNRKPIYACQYFMARHHWQIIHHTQRGVREGSCTAIDIGAVPHSVLKTASKAANLFGDGLYGVDLKEIDGKVYLIEVNDNPSIDAGVEDAILKDDLYRLIIDEFVNRLSARQRG